MCSFAPLLAPCFPLLPRGPAPSVCPSLGSCLPLFCFWLPPWSRSSLLLRALRVPLALHRATPVSPPRAPSLACLPSHPPSLCGSCLQFFDRPHCLCRAVSRVCHPRALPLPLSVVPTLFHGGSPTLVLFPRSLYLSSSGMPRFTVWGGGGLLADWIVALLEDWFDAGCWDSTTAMSRTLPARVNSTPQ